MLKRLALGLVGSWILAHIVELAFGWPPSELTTWVLFLVILYEESKGLFAPAFTAAGNALHFVKRIAFFLACFFLLRFLIWQVFDFGFLGSLNAWGQVGGVNGLFRNATSDAARNIVLHELLASGVAAVVSYMFMNETLPPRHA